MSTHTKSFLSAMMLIAVLSIGLEAAVKPKAETVNIQTSAICQSCKNRIEKALRSVEGVQEAALNLGNKKVRVKYDPAKISPDQIRDVIANTGYDADGVKKNQDAFMKLPDCCQKPTGGHH